MRFAYNTNGLANHRLDDALMLIHEAGFRGVALTLDHHHLDPFAPDLERRATELATRLRDLDLGLVVETGARFLLDPRHKHEPTLLSPTSTGRARRIEFLKRAVDVAAVCSAETVSMWAGVPRENNVDPERLWERLVHGVGEVLEYASRAGVALSFEPEPGMLVETVDDFRRLRRDVATVPGRRLRLALDVGHCLVTGDRDPADAVRESARDLGTITIEDMRRGSHVHLPFGEGDVDVPSVLEAIRAIEWQGLVCVELSRESHRGAEMCARAAQWLQRHL